MNRCSEQKLYNEHCRYIIGKRDRMQKKIVICIFVVLLLMNFFVNTSSALNPSTPIITIPVGNIYQGQVIEISVRSSVNYAVDISYFVIQIWDYDIDAYHPQIEKTYSNVQKSGHTYSISFSYDTSDIWYKNIQISAKAVDENGQESSWGSNSIYVIGYENPGDPTIHTDKNSYTAGENMRVTCSALPNHYKTGAKVDYFSISAYEYSDGSTDGTLIFNQNINAYKTDIYAYSATVSIEVPQCDKISIVAWTYGDGAISKNADQVNVSIISTKATLSVYVKDENGNPIDNAQVSCGTELYFTDYQGYASFFVEKDSNYNIVASKNGYDTQRMDNYYFNADETLVLSLSSTQNDTTTSTPGFELIVVICAITFALLFKRYRIKNN